MRHQWAEVLLVTKQMQSAEHGGDYQSLVQLEIRRNALLNDLKSSLKSPWDGDLSDSELVREILACNMELQESMSNKTTRVQRELIQLRRHSNQISHYPK